MKIGERKYLFLIALIAFLFSCSYEFPETEPYSQQDLGEINVENIVAVGDDYLAGVMDGALYSAGQENSLAAIVVSQIQKIQDIQFIQPNVNSKNGYNFYTSTENKNFGKWIYKFEGQFETEPKRELTNGEFVQDYSGDLNSLNNLAIPQLSVQEINSSELSLNPYFKRITSGNSFDYSGQISQKSPTFILMWLGINDYLKYAINGASDISELSTLNDFQSKLDLFVTQLLESTNSKIVIGNLISIKDLPYFYKNQYNFIRLSNAKKGAAQNKFNKYNVAVAAHNVRKPTDQKRKMISFEDNGATLYPQPIVVIDETLPDALYPDGSQLEKYRQLTKNEMALFSISTEMVSSGWGSEKPLPDNYYLTENQLNLIESRINSFNQVIQNLTNANADRIVLANIKEAVKKVADTGKEDAWGIKLVNEIIYSNGVPLEGGLDINSIFSLDALHFNQRGNAYISNVFIETINFNFQSKIPATKINDFAGNVYTF